MSVIFAVVVVILMLMLCVAANMGADVGGVDANARVGNVPIAVCVRVCRIVVSVAVGVVVTGRIGVGDVDVVGVGVDCDGGVGDAHGYSVDIGGVVCTLASVLCRWCFCCCCGYCRRR